MGEASGSWWGAYTIPARTAARWRIGPFELWASRTDREWRIGHRRGADLHDGTVEHTCPADEPPADAPDVTWVRFALERTGEELHLSPRTADRHVVIRPRDTVVVPSGERAILYVSSPVWVALATRDGARELVEIPLWRPTDTWFGSRTEGELCYASRTQGARDLDELVRLPHRAVTPVTVRNDAAEALPIEHISLPVDHLSLFQGERGDLWTEPVTLVRLEADEPARVELGEAAPPEARAATRVAGPRRVEGRHFAARVFAGLLGL